MQIGIGYITYNRPRHIELATSQIAKHSPHDVELFVYDDKDKKGIAHGKNECLKALRHCDYIFLFDDDCFPVKDGWIDFFINASHQTDQQHFLYLKETPSIEMIAEYPFANCAIQQFNNCGGVFMFLTKKVIEKVGGFHPEYGRYGFEHAGYSQRIHTAGLTLAPYLTVKGAGEYLYAMDYDFHLPFNKQVRHTSSMAAELSKLEYYIRQNSEVYKKDLEIIYQNL